MNPVLTGDNTEIILRFQAAFKDSKNVEDRKYATGKAFDSLGNLLCYKPNKEFYRQVFEQHQGVTMRQATLYRLSKKAAKNPKEVVDILDGTLQQYIGVLVSEGPHRNDDQAKRLRKDMNLPERVFETIIVQAHIKEKMWQEVKTKIDMKKPPCPFASIGELCFTANNKEKAVDAIKKIPDAE